MEFNEPQPLQNEPGTTTYPHFFYLKHVVTCLTLLENMAFTTGI